MLLTCEVKVLVQGDFQAFLSLRGSLLLALFKHWYKKKMQLWVIFLPGLEPSLKDLYSSTTLSSLDKTLLYLWTIYNLQKKDNFLEFRESNLPDHWDKL